MSEWDGTSWEGTAIQLSTSFEDAVDTILHRREHPRLGAWRIPSVREALSVPAIHRAVALISSTTGMLSMQAFRNGVAMEEPPRLVVRPDPDEPPGTFYAQSAANLAKYGEYVWWIAGRDNDGNAAALVNVPLHELKVDRNDKNRRRATYRWGNIESTRWTPTNPTGAFVHRKYALNDPFSLRGEGPLQMARAAVSIAVESQTWAANFFGDGGFGRDVVKYAGYLDPTLKDDMGVPDPDNGLSEADRFRAQYMSRDNNTPIIIDQAIESITHPSIDPETSQVLTARLHQRGDAALLYGIPGKFAEYVQSGTSLTYQNVEMAFTDLIKSCLQPLYLEPIEQDMSDLQTRTTVTRFNVKGFLRADPKTRAEVYQILVPLGVMSVEQAAREEGYMPGDVEYAPVPFSPVVPPAIRAASAQVPMSLAADVRCPNCRKLVANALGPGSEVVCSRCKTVVRGPDVIDVTPRETVALNVAPQAPEITVHNHPPAIEMPPVQVTMHMPDTQARIGNLEEEMRRLIAAMGSLATHHDSLRDDLDGRLAEVSAQHAAATAELTAHQAEVADRLAELARPKIWTPERDEKGQIVKMRSDAA